MRKSIQLKVRFCVDNLSASKTQRKWRKATKNAILVFLLIIVVLSGITVFINLVDYQIPVFNPAPPTANRYISLRYPQHGAVPLLLALHINLTTSGDFVQGQAVTISVSGWITNDLLQNLTSYSPNSNNSGINVGFEGAPLLVNAEGLGFNENEPPFSVNSPTGMAVVLMINRTANENRLYSPPQTIKWLSQGDYNPEIMFWVGDSSNIQEVDLVYDNDVMHIGSAESLQAARYNRINEVVSVVLAVFAFVEVSKMLYESFFKKEK
jgi:hypothetical protein